MDSTKTAIKSLVLDLRKSLEADIDVGLRRYGITPTALRPLDTLKHLNDRELAARIRMEEAIRHELGRDETTDDLADAVHWFVREVAFTHLNRLVGLKALEVRGLAPESIQIRSEYGNRSRALRDYRGEHPEAASLPDDGLERAIQHVCRLIYPEFRLLFDVGDPAEMRDAPSNSLLWPSTPTLKACIARINELDGKIGRSGPPAHDKATPEQSVWAEDEIIGWIYQFYNAEEKVSIRKKGKPNHPAEVAVINQFFTPRWIVKFLVDNTLGRLWLEMHPDSPRVRERCAYLVPEPASSDQSSVSSDPNSPVNNPDAEPRRAAKRPQDIRLIDPACGTMHFGHYAFEVFQAIYADAREQGWVKGSDALSDEQVPAAILQNNLFGVDIDLRAVQLAALSLFMKAKSANPEAHVGQVNLIVADAHLPRGEVRADFLAQYASEPVILKAFQEVFESLDNVAEVGSLLRVEERFRQVLASAGYQSKAPKAKAGAQQAGFAEIAPGWSLEHTVEQMLGHLRQFARRALQEHDLNAQLFATETEKSVALLDVFLHGYDVVVMNPPYGIGTNESKSILQKLYPNSWNDLYAAFLERAIDLLHPSGMCGALTSRTFMFLPRLEKVRKEVILANATMKALLDLGHEVLDDAMVETAAYAFAKNVFQKDQPEGVYFRLLDIDPESRNGEFKSNLKSLIGNNSVLEKRIYSIAQSEFVNIPSSAFAYWVPKTLLSVHKANEKLGKSAEVRPGLTTLDNDQYVREHWEVKHSTIGHGKKWVPFAKGGDYSPYYFDNDLLVLWENEGAELKRFARTKGGAETRFIANQSFYFKEGLTYPRVTNKGFNVRHLPPGHIFAEKGISIFPEKLEDLWHLLGYLNSNFVQYLLLLQTASRSWEKSAVASLPYRAPNSDQSIRQNAKLIFEIKQIWDTGNETSTCFSKPLILQIIDGTLKLPGITEQNLPKKQNLQAIVKEAISEEAATNKNLQDLQAIINKDVFDIYGVSEADRESIENELDRPKQIVWSYAERMSKKQKATEHVARLMSYCLLSAIQDDPDGILPLTEASGHATVLRYVQSGLESHFGESAAYQVELDSADYLGRPLGEWLLKNFWKDYHIKWYKKRPILWQLQSQKGHFACLVHIHKMDRDTLPKVRSQYLWPARNTCQAALESARMREDAGERGAAREVAEFESMLDDLNNFERRLSDVIEARVPCDIPDWAQGPYRDGAYDPVLDDGVAVNILPLQEAGILAKGKVV